MKLQPYKEILKMGKEKIDAALAVPRSRKAKAQAKLKLAEMDEQIATQEARINELASVKDLDFDGILDAQDKLALLIRRKSKFEELSVQLFPDD